MLKEDINDAPTEANARLIQRDTVMSGEVGFGNDVEIINQSSNTKGKTANEPQEPKAARSSFAEMTGVAAYVDKMRFSEGFKDDSEEENLEIQNATPLT